MNTDNQKPWLYRSVKSTLSLAFFLEMLLSYFMPFSDKGNQVGIGFPYTYLYIQKQGVLDTSPFFLYRFESAEIDFESFLFVSIIKIPLLVFFGIK